VYDVPGGEALLTAAGELDHQPAGAVDLDDPAGQRAASGKRRSHVSTQRRGELPVRRQHRLGPPADGQPPAVRRRQLPQHREQDRWAVGGLAGLDRE